MILTGTCKAREVNINLSTTNTKTYDDKPYQLITITYINGRVAETFLRNPQNNNDAYLKSTFSYQVVNEITYVEIQEVSYSDGAIIASRTYKRHYIESPRDEIYLTSNQLDEPILEQYENGNLIKVGFRSDQGSFTAYDTTWAFTLHYKY